MTYSPWADLAQRTHLTLVITDLPEGDGWWVPAVPGIALDAGLTRVGRRCTLAHELAHDDHHDQQVNHCGPDGPRQARRQERRADLRAARRLIATGDLIAALIAHPDDPHLVAEHLDVTTDVLAVRLTNLHPAEQAALAQEVARADHAA